MKHIIASNIFQHIFEGKIKARVNIRSQNIFKYEIWGSHSSDAQDSSLLGCYIMSLGEWLPVFWRTILPSPLGSIYCFNLKDEGHNILWNITLQCSITHQKTWNFGLNLILDSFIINDNDRPSVTYFILKYAPIQTFPFQYSVSLLWVIYLKTVQLHLQEFQGYTYRCILSL